MLEQRMITTAYPMLLRLMLEYGNSKIEFSIPKCIKEYNNKFENAIFTVRSNGSIRMYVDANSQSSYINANISSKTKKCPILNFFTSSNFVTETDTYVKYCDAIVSELEKYKELENKASKVFDRLDAFNVTLTRSVITEKKH